MKLIAEWKQAYKMFSVQAMGLSTAGLTTWALLPEDLKAALPHWLVPAVAAATLALGIAGRLVSQKPEDPEETKPGAK